jgi:uncharacterized protein HemX
MVASTVQQVPGQKPAEDALGNIAAQGILGSLCVVLIVVVGWTLRGWLKEKDKRFTDQKALLDTVKEHNKAATELAVQATKSQAELSNSLTNHTSSLTNVQHTLNTQQASLDNLSATVNRMDGRVA